MWPHLVSSSTARESHGAEKYFESNLPMLARSMDLSANFCGFLASQCGSREKGVNPSGASATWGKGSPSGMGLGMIR